MCAEAVIRRAGDEHGRNIISCVREMRLSRQVVTESSQPDRGSIRPVIRWAIIGTTVAVLFVFAHVEATGDNILNLLQAGASGPSARIIHHDFPSAPLPVTAGYDGQQFYAIARAPMHWHSVAASLDRPRYRLGRSLFSWMGWILHPSGGGNGLVAALFVVGVGALFGGAMVFGIAALRAGRSPAWAALYPLLPGSLISLRITTADALAVSFAIASVVAERRRRPVVAVVSALLCVLTKEVLFAIVLGNALARRSRTAVIACAVSGVSFLAFWMVLGLVLSSTSTGVLDLSWPLIGYAGAFRRWIGGHDLVAAASFAVFVATLGAAVLHAYRYERRELWTLGVPLSYLLWLRPDPLELDLAGPRTFLPLTALSLLVILWCGRPPVGGGRSAPGRLHR
ncbi:MAG: hypothetical protein NVS3B21_00930 [Acidimicrobiales bacterium]